jgi:hypothetical protein
MKTDESTLTYYLIRISIILGSTFISLPNDNEPTTQWFTRFSAWFSVYVHVFCAFVVIKSNHPIEALKRLFLWCGLEFGLYVISKPDYKTPFFVVGTALISALVIIDWIWASMIKINRHELHRPIQPLTYILEGEEFFIVFGDKPTKLHEKCHSTTVDQLTFHNDPDSNKIRMISFPTKFMLHPIKLLFNCDHQTDSIYIRSIADVTKITHGQEYKGIEITFADDKIFSLKIQCDQIEFDHGL